MNKITFKYKKRNVEFYNVPHSLARAFEIILHYIENDPYNNIFSSESEAENNDDLCENCPYKDTLICETDRPCED